MKKKVIYLIIIFIINLSALLLLNTTSYAGSQKFNELQYNVKLNEDGSASVIETWDINVSDTNTLFKTFDLDTSKYGDITNVNVAEITSSGEKLEFYNTGVYAYHVANGGYYALNRNSREFEIAWGVSIENRQDKKYEITYEIQDAIKSYDDCSEFYWQFIGDTNQIPANLVHGKITLPAPVLNKDNLKVWAHGPLDGNIEITDNSTVSFEVEKLKSENMVEVRIVTTEDIFSQNSNILKTNKIEQIIKEETKWANDANRERDIFNTVVVVVIIIGIIIITIFIIVIIRYVKQLSNVRKIKPTQEIQYFREIPDEEATPAEASFLYYFDKKMSFNNNLSKIVSATILNLALKKEIKFEQDEKDKVYIIINETEQKGKLKDDEKSIFDLLVNVRDYSKSKNKDYDNKISMKDIEKYAKRYDTKFLSKIESIEKTVKEFQKKNENYSVDLEKVSEKWRNKSIAYYMVGIFCIFGAIFIIPLLLTIPCMICGILCSKIANKTRKLTQKGTDEQEKWKALKRYMDDFSLLNEREVPELALWEKYLVFATSFGIADKVLSQLKLKYPEISDREYMVSHGYTYMYMMNRISFDTMIVSGMQKAYSTGVNQRAARNYSSGSGRRRWLFSWRSAGGGGGRSEWVADKNRGRLNFVYLCFLLYRKIEAFFI